MNINILYHYSYIFNKTNELLFISIYKVNTNELLKYYIVKQKNIKKTNKIYKTYGDYNENK